MPETIYTNPFYKFVTGLGSEVLPVTDGNYLSPDMDSAIDNTKIFYIEFFSDAGGTIPVAPTAGTVTVSGSPLGSVFLDAVANGTIQAPDVIPRVSSEVGLYTPPTFYGRMVKGLVVTSGITGALTMRCGFWSFGQ